VGRRYELVLSLNDLALDDEAMADRLRTTIMRIYGVFRRATEQDTRKRVHRKGFPRHVEIAKTRSTCNSISGCDDSIDDLARVVVARLANKETALTVVTAKDVEPTLRRWYQKNDYRSLLEALGSLQHTIVCELLAYLRDALKAIWFHYEEGGRWQMAQSSVDKYALRKRVTHGLKYLNARSYHGRPRRQTKRRGIPEGTSVGGRRFRISASQHIGESGIYRTSRPPRTRVA
jgi:hypothetical protein